jgi:4-diphosphocytidyl-2-C-methyl-D-erythritol kinase
MADKALNMPAQFSAETAFAKLNLALHVRARREDGYHDLESLFAFCADGDALTGTLRDDGALTLGITGDFAEGLSAGADNLVLRAALALQSASGTHFGADLVLDKALPIASGIGGGSADAAAALRLLIRLWDLRPMELDLPTIALALGADVADCVWQRCGRAVGRGRC